MGDERSQQREELAHENEQRDRVGDVHLGGKKSESTGGTKPAEPTQHFLRAVWEHDDG